MWAASKEDTAMVKLLAGYGAHLLKPDKDGLTLLHISAGLGDVRTLDYIIKQKQTNSIDLLSEQVSLKLTFANT